MRIPASIVGRGPEECHPWSLLPGSVGTPDAALPATEHLNYFVADESFFKRRGKMIKLVSDALRSGAPTAKVVSRRYTEGIPYVPDQARTSLATTLDRYAAGIASPKEES
jgi:hypothetical protein